MRRRVICVDRNNNNVTVDDRFCDANTKPPEEASCGSGPCATGWRKGPWSKVIENKIDRYLAIILLQCSRTCRTGYQRRKVECIDTGAVVPDDQCDVDLRPVSERFCNEHIKCFRELSNCTLWSTSDCYIIVLTFYSAACQDEYPYHCRKLMQTPMGCMGDYARKICCWSCSND